VDFSIFNCTVTYMPQFYAYIQGSWRVKMAYFC